MKLEKEILIKLVIKSSSICWNNTESLWLVKVDLVLICEWICEMQGEQETQ